MNVPTIEAKTYEERWKAADLASEYRQAVRVRRNAEDEQCAKAFGIMAKGGRLLDIDDVMRRAGVDSHYRPKLAIARADATLCWYFPADQRFAIREWNPHAYTRFDFPRGTFPRPESRASEASRWRAVVPLIPPHLRPLGHLRNYHILWEAEWEAMPADPLLLRRIGKGRLFAILAAWDLTELERAVLRGRLPQT